MKTHRLVLLTILLVMLVATANAQGSQNVGFAIAQQQLNNTNQVTPYGSINYQQTGIMKGPDGWNIPISTATTTLSPGMQKLFNANLANSQATSGVEGSLLKNAQGNIEEGRGPDPTHIEPHPAAFCL